MGLALRPWPGAFANVVTGSSAFGLVVLAYLKAHFHGAGHWPVIATLLVIACLYLIVAGGRLQLERAAKPRLVFLDPPPARGSLITPSSGGAGAPLWGKFVTIPVANIPERPTVDAWARDVWAKLTFYGGEKELFTIRGRWSGGYQIPALNLGPHDQIPPQLQDIPPNEQPEHIDVAVKFGTAFDRHAYAYNTESQQRGDARFDDWKLVDHGHHVQAVLKGSGVSAEQWFLLENYSEHPHGLPGFELRLTKVGRPAWSTPRKSGLRRRQEP